MILETIPFQHGKVNIGNNRTLRVKVTNRCPFACEFCHHEGSSNSQDILINGKTITTFKRFYNELKLNQVHLTGGEPTSHPDIFKLIELFKTIGFDVKMTSNGYFPDKILEMLLKSGLSGINFSVHTLNPIRLANIQKPRRNFQWGLNALGRQLSNIKNAQNLGIPAKLNTVIQEDTSIDDIISFCKEESIELRILDELSPNSVSTQKIIELLRARGSVIVAMNAANGTSAFSYDVVTNDGFKFKVKAIRKNTLSSLCNACDIRDNCKEWFYGIRIEQQESHLMVRLCLERQDSDALQSIEDFFESEHFTKLICVNEL